MVNVNHNNVDARYMDPKFWIQEGITEDAVYAALYQWRISDVKDRDFYLSRIRNIFDNTYKPYKW